MSKVLELSYLEETDDFSTTTGETVQGKTQSGILINFHVHDLWECPEDAVIGRDLFSAAEFLETLQLGMKIAQEGYTEIRLVDVPKEEE